MCNVIAPQNAQNMSAKERDMFKDVQFFAKECDIV